MSKKVLYLSWMSWEGFIVGMHACMRQCFFCWTLSQFFSFDYLDAFHTVFNKFFYSLSSEGHEVVIVFVVLSDCVICHVVHTLFLCNSGSWVNSFWQTFSIVNCIDTSVDFTFLWGLGWACIFRVLRFLYTTATITRTCCSPLFMSIQVSLILCLVFSFFKVYCPCLWL